MSSRRPTSTSASSSRNASIISPTQHHAPATPSGLRESVTVARSLENVRENVREQDGTHDEQQETSPSAPTASRTHPTHDDQQPDTHAHRLDGRPQGTAENGNDAATETTALLRKPFEFTVGTSAHNGPCDHGTFSPRLESRTNSLRSANSGFGFGGSPPRRTGSGEGGGSVFGSMFGVRRSNKKMSTTSYLAERHGITNTRRMYVWLEPQNPLGSPADLYARQVLCILRSLLCLDTTIQMGAFKRRSRSGPDHGLVLPADGPFVCCEPRPRTADQRIVLFRLQSSPLCPAGELSPDGRWSRGGW